MAADVREEQRGRDIETLKVEIDKLRADVAATTRTLKDLGGSLGAQAAATLRGSAERARSEVHKAADDVSHQIEERPLISIIGAFLIGLVLGTLLSRR